MESPLKGIYLDLQNGQNNPILPILSILGYRTIILEGSFKGDMGFPKIRGSFLGGPYKKDYSILGSRLGSPYFGRLPRAFLKGSFKGDIGPYNTGAIYWSYGWLSKGLL